MNNHLDNNIQLENKAVNLIFSLPEPEKKTTITVEEFVDGNNNAIELYTYLNQSGLSFLQHYKIIGGGHYWFDLSVNGQNLDQLIWQFFKKHDNEQTF